jgi:hypothetical protein
VLVLNPNRTLCNLHNDLDEYVGCCASNEIIRNMENMKFNEIIELKEAFEIILMCLSVGRTYN